MAIKNRLSCLLGERKINISELSRQTGVSRTTITKIYYGDEKSISYVVLQKICDALSCKTCDFFDDCGGCENND